MTLEKLLNHLNLVYPWKNNNYYAHNGKYGSESDNAIATTNSYFSKK
jgi:hypothetical protein